MTTWLVEYRPYLKADLESGKEHEIPCFRIVSTDNPEVWIAQTNEELPREAQEEAALIMADALSKVLGI